VLPNEINNEIIISKVLKVSKGYAPVFLFLFFVDVEPR
jgi:hypothetical protein